MNATLRLIASLALVGLGVFLIVRSCNSSPAGCCELAKECRQ